MKRMFLILVVVLMIVLISGCATMRYNEELQEPYTQTEIEIAGMGAIVTTIFTVITAGIMYQSLHGF